MVATRFVFLPLFFFSFLSVSGRICIQNGGIVGWGHVLGCSCLVPTLSFLVIDRTSLLRRCRSNRWQWGKKIRTKEEQVFFFSIDDPMLTLQVCHNLDRRRGHLNRVTLEGSHNKDDE